MSIFRNTYFQNEFRESDHLKVHANVCDMTSRLKVGDSMTKVFIFRMVVLPIHCAIQQ